MKLRISRTILMAAEVLAFASAAFGQEVNLRAKVPFAFVLGDKTYPAGEYAVQTVTTQDTSLYIKNQDEAKPALLLSDLRTASNPAKHSVLVFHQIGDTHFLYQVWVAGSEVGREFAKSKTETRMARSGTKTETETVEVAANVSH